MTDKEAKEVEKLDVVAHAAKTLDLENWEENPALDKRLNRKFDRNILPYLFGIW